MTYEEAHQVMLAHPLRREPMRTDGVVCGETVQYDLGALDDETRQALARPIIDHIEHRNLEKAMLARTEQLPERLADARRTIEDAAAALCRQLNDKLAGDGFAADGAEDLAVMIKSACDASATLAGIREAFCPTPRRGTKACID
jgi:hypothetical protein